MAARPEEWATESDGIERRPQWDNGVASALLRLRDSRRLPDSAYALCARGGLDSRYSGGAALVDKPIPEAVPHLPRRPGGRLTSLGG
jgi:hypothetical protein